MSRRPILLHPDPRLKRQCAPVADVTDVTRALLDEMLETMYAAPGIGLAAPQIGVDARALVMDCAEKESARQPIAMLNPEIVAISDALNEHEEGCLSLPDIFGFVTRPAEVRVRWLSPQGEIEERDFAGLWATCVQHEIDHLNGKLFIDYLGAMRRQMITRRMQKLKREQARA
jgi:peptide deformylase